MWEIWLLSLVSQLLGMFQHLITLNFDRHAYLIPSLSAGMQVFRSSKLTYVDSGLSCDTFNIIHVLDAVGIAAEINQALQHFRQEEKAYCIWVSESQLSPELQVVFQELAIHQQNMEPGMVLDLQQYEPLTSVSHANIEKVTTPAQLAEFAASIAANWSPPDQNVLRYYEQVAPVILNPAHGVQLLIYREKGQVVSCLEMFPSDAATIGFYSLATLEAHRGKGIASAMLLFSLNLAKQSGYRQVILQASEDGLRIYEKLGFRRVENYYEYA